MAVGMFFPINPAFTSSSIDAFTQTNSQPVVFPTSNPRVASYFPFHTQYTNYFYSHGNEWTTLFIDAPQQTQSSASDHFTAVGSIEGPQSSSANRLHRRYAST